MKNIILLIFLFSSCLSFADSIETKLKQYKNLFDSGYVNKAEYERLKEGMLFYTPERKAQSEFILKKSIEEYKRIYTAELASGTILLVGGCVTMGMAAWVRKNKYPNVFSKDFTTQSSMYKQKYITMFAVGGALAGLGVVLEALGIYNHTMYLKKSREVTIGMANENIGLCLKFN